MWKEDQMLWCHEIDKKVETWKDKKNRREKVRPKHLNTLAGAMRYNNYICQV